MKRSTLPPTRTLVVIALALTASVAIAQAPPNIVSTNPPIGARDVDPGLTEITVTFDQDMASGFSWTGGGEERPESTGSPRWIDSRTCVLPVALQPGRYYRVGINSQSHRNFRSQAGVPTPPQAIYFCTVGASPDDIASLQPPAIVETVPPMGATDVDPGLSEIRITFNQSMDSGRSLTGGGDTFPTIPEGGEITWSADRKTIMFPVTLQPNHEYRFGVNSPSHRNFRSARGISVDPVLFSFRTGGE
jgi:hypothetical protein